MFGKRTAASKACIPCRDRKRKCDKTTPSCSLCYRLGRICTYAPVSPSPSRTSSEIGTNTLWDDLSFKLPGSVRPDIHREVTDQLSKFVGDVSDVRAVAKIYFNGIHSWLPVVPESQFYECLPSIFISPKADQSLLCLSMALINLFPTSEDGYSDEGKFNTLYTLLKIVIARLEAADINSIEVVQGRLLVTLFEVGHGINGAYISIAALARAAAAIGINETVNAPVSPKCEEQLRVWWGIVMLDRFFTLARGSDLICATDGLGSPRHLPRDGNVWDQKIIDSLAPLPMSTPSSVRVGPFARQAQVSHLTNLLLNHLRSTTSSDFDMEESDQLARTLLSFSLLFPEETPQPWPRYCGAIGMCYSSLMTLHNSRPPSVLSTEFLDMTLRGIGYVCTKFNLRIRQVDVASVSPFPAHGLYLAAVTQNRIWRETGNRKSKEERDELVGMLGFIARRWGSAAKYLKMLEQETGDLGQCTNRLQRDETMNEETVSSP